MNLNVLKGYIALAMNQSGRSTQEVQDALEAADRLTTITEEEALNYLEHQEYKQNNKKEETTDER